MGGSSSESEPMHMAGKGAVVNINFRTCAALSRGRNGGMVVSSLSNIVDMGKGSLRLMTM